jgi:hypothetical protein
MLISTAIEPATYVPNVPIAHAVAGDIVCSLASARLRVA